MLSCDSNTETYKWSICNAISTSIFRRSILPNMLAISSFLNIHTSASPAFFSLPPSVILVRSNSSACLNWLRGPFSTPRTRTAVYHGVVESPLLEAGPEGCEETVEIGSLDRTLCAVFRGILNVVQIPKDLSREL